MTLPVPKTLQITSYGDPRGRFSELCRVSSLPQFLETPFDIAQINFSQSETGTFRGLHTRKPGSEEDKLLFVLDGTLVDFCLDTRAQSPNQGEIQEFELDAATNNCIFIPAGYAHGLLARTNISLIYLTSCEYDPSLEISIKISTDVLQKYQSDPLIMSHRDTVAEDWSQLVDSIFGRFLGN